MYSLAYVTSRGAIVLNFEPSQLCKASCEGISELKSSHLFFSRSNLEILINYLGFGTNPKYLVVITIKMLVSAIYVIAVG